MSAPTTGLRARLEAAKRATGLTLAQLTVMDRDGDPFRLDTDARRIAAAWLVDQLDALGVLADPAATIHLRGTHYVLLGRAKPGGEPYANTDADWSWLSDDAMKAARWLGLLPWHRITDQRNDAPTLRIRPPKAWAGVVGGQGPDLTVDALRPRPEATDWTGRQPWRLALIGEKSSLAPVLGPIADAYDADLYLPGGDASDTGLRQLAEAAAADGRPLAVFYFADADPSGWNMPIVVARKLQAWQETDWPALIFRVHRVALTPDQVRRFDLPSTPLKATESRGDAWREAMGTEQTEVDALAALRPADLAQLARDALAPYFDATLAERTDAARQAWEKATQRLIDARTDRAARRAARRTVARMRARLDALVASLAVDLDAADLPAAVLPSPELDAVVGAKAPPPLIDSRWGFTQGTVVLANDRAYLDTGPVVAQLHARLTEHQAERLAELLAEPEADQGGQG